MAGSLIPRTAPSLQGLRQVNRYAQEQYPLAYQTAQMHPAVGIPTSVMNYADAMEAGNREDAIQAALSGIPLANSFKIGTALPRASSALMSDLSRASQQYGPGLRGWMNTLGRRAAAGENAAEFAAAGEDTGNQIRDYVRAR